MALTVRQRVFVEEYLRLFNATQAALAAGYSTRSAAAIGSENLKKLEIAAEIQQRLRETAMSADEVLMRLAAQARGTLADFLTEGNQLDLAKGRDAQQLHLLKRVKQRRRIVHGDDGLIEMVETEFELYDAQRALEVLAKAHGLLADAVTLSGGDKDVVIRVVYGERGDDSSAETAL